MRIKIIFLLFIQFLVFNSACKNKTEEKKIKFINEFKYIKSIQLVKKENEYNLVYNNETISGIKKIKSCVVISAAVFGYINLLNAEKYVKGVINPKYIYNTKILSLIKKDSIKNLGFDANINTEEIIKINPELIITSSNPSLKKSLNLLKKLGYKIIYIDEYKEQNPLARSEYIKLFGILFNKKNKSDSIFNSVEKNYNQLKEKTKKIAKRPTAFLGIIYGDTWFMPGANTYITNIIKDAGIHYLWEDSKKDMLMLSFEEVYFKAKNADYWLNISDIRKKENLNNAYRKYKWFDAFKTNKLYSFTNQINNENNSNNFYEEGTVRCDLILQDLIKIAHPALLKSNTLYFYQKIE